MIGRLNHVAIAVNTSPPRRACIARRSGGGFGAAAAAEHGDVVFINRRIPDRAPGIARETPQSRRSWPRPERRHAPSATRWTTSGGPRPVVAGGSRVLGSGEPTTGAHGKPVLSCTPGLLRHPRRTRQREAHRWASSSGQPVPSDHPRGGLACRRRRALGVRASASPWRAPSPLFVVWWTALFPCCLRVRVGRGGDIAGGSDRGAGPALALRKGHWTTLVAAVVFTSGLALAATGYESPQNKREAVPALCLSRNPGICGCHRPGRMGVFLPRLGPTCSLMQKAFRQKAYSGVPGLSPRRHEIVRAAAGLSVASTKGKAPISPRAVCLSFPPRCIVCRSRIAPSSSRAVVPEGASMRLSRYFRHPPVHAGRRPRSSRTGSCCGWSHRQRGRELFVLPIGCACSAINASSARADGPGRRNLMRRSFGRPCANPALRRLRQGDLRIPTATSARCSMATREMVTDIVRST